MLRDVDQILFTSRAGEISRPGKLISSLPMRTKKEKKNLNRYSWTYAIYSVFVEDLGN